MSPMAARNSMMGIMIVTLKAKLYIVLPPPSQQCTHNHNYPHMHMRMRMRVRA